MNIQDTFFGQIRQCSLSDLRYIKHSLEGLWGLCRAVQRTLNVWWGCGVVGLWGCGVSGVWDLGTLCGGVPHRSCWLNPAIHAKVGTVCPILDCA